MNAFIMLEKVIYLFIYFFFPQKMFILFCWDFKQFTPSVSSLVVFAWFLHVAFEMHLRLCFYLCPYGLSLETSFCPLRTWVCVVTVLVSLLPFLFPITKALPFFPFWLFNISTFSYWLGRQLPPFFFPLPPLCSVTVFHLALCHTFRHLPHLSTSGSLSCFSELSDGDRCSFLLQT